MFLSLTAPPSHVFPIGFIHLLLCNPRDNSDVSSRRAIAIVAAISPSDNAGERSIAHDDRIDQIAAIDTTGHPNSSFMRKESFLDHHPLTSNTLHRTLRLDCEFLPTFHSKIVQTDRDDVIFALNMNEVQHHKRGVLVGDGCISIDRLDRSC
jgi:hypothetical protein